MLSMDSGHVQWLEGDRYRLVFSLGSKPNGKPNKVYRRGRGTPEQAERHRRRVARALRQNGHRNDRMPFSDLLDLYFEDRQSGWRPSTLRRNLRVARRLKSQLGSLPIHRLEASTGSDYKRWALGEGGVAGRPLSPGSVREDMVMLLCALDFAVDNRWLDANIVRRKRLLPKANTPPVEWLEVDEIEMLLAATNGTNVHPLVAVGLDCGLRIAELLGLRWRDIDFKESVIGVERQLEKIDGSWTWSPLKTGASRRVVPFGRRTRQVLSHLHEGAISEHASGVGPVVSARAVFSDGGGAPTIPNTASLRLLRVTRRLGWKNRTFHTLRHTYVSHMLRAGVDPKTLAAWAGHKDPGFMLRRYAHALRAVGPSPSYIDDIAFRGSQASNVGQNP